MKIGFYDTDPAGGMTPMALKLKEENISFDTIYNKDLESIKDLDLLVMDYTALPHLPKLILKDHDKRIKNMVELNKNTEFLIMIPGENWIFELNKRIGLQKNIEYVIGEDLSKLTKFLEKHRK